MKKFSGIPVTDGEEVFRTIHGSLTNNIPFRERGTCTAETIFDILLRAAGRADSIENTCRTLQNVPCGNTVRKSLGQYESVRETEDAADKTLPDCVPPRIRGGKQRIAFDYNKLPYYGTPSHAEEPYVSKGKAESGTTLFYTYATLCVIRKGKRVTAAITSVRHDDTYVAVITRLLDYISHSDIKTKCLYADREFFSVPVIRWLKALLIPFVIPVVIRGKNGGTRALVREKRTRKAVCATDSSEYGSVTFDVWVVCVCARGRYGRHGREVFAYAVCNPGTALCRIHRAYRRRFGIETSYRQKNLCRIRTSAKNPAVRFLFVGISFIIINLWIYLLWKKVSYPRKGGRLIFNELFPLKLMLTLFCTIIEQKYKTYNIIYL